MVQAGEREVCARLVAAAMLFGQAATDMLQEGHRKLLEHCAEDSSCCVHSLFLALHCNTSLILHQFFACMSNPLRTHSTIMVFEGCFLDMLQTNSRGT